MAEGISAGIKILYLHSYSFVDIFATYKRKQVCLLSTKTLEKWVH